MKSQLVKKLTAVIMCLILFVTVCVGCKKTTPDSYKWKTRIEEEKVWVEYEKDDTSSENDVTSDDFNDNSDYSDSSDDSNDNTSSTPIVQPGLDLTVTVDSADKPTVKNTANLLNPITAKSDAQAEILRNKVLNSKSAEVKVTGEVYYISYRGNDQNDGLSPKTPWKTLKKLANSLQVGQGDAVLFERGGVYRGGVDCVSGVFYGAYGEGDKPCIYRSEKNYAKTTWVSEGNNIWTINDILENVGIIAFEHGKAAGSRKFNKSELTQNGDFFSDETGKLYLYMDGQPAQKYTSIEIGTNSHIFNIPSNAHDITIDNFTLKYGGAMGVRVSSGVKNITITNCEIGWIGGSILEGYGDGTARYGNGIEFWQACENVLVQNNWIYQIYDTGFTHQGNSGKFVVKNLLFTGNLVEYCNYASIEYWAPAEGSQRIEDVEYSNNILRFAGYGRETPKGQPSCHIWTTDSFNEAKNLVIKDNILDTALKSHLRIIHMGGTFPLMSGNTYIGKIGELLGYISNKTDAVPYLFESEIEDVIRAAWNDSTAKIIFND